MNTFEMFFQIFFSPKCFVADEAFKVFWSLFDAHYFQCLHLKIVQLAKNRRMFFFKKMGQSRPLFCLFSFFSSYNFNNTNWKKHWWCAWDSNPGLQDGGRRQNHGAMAATPTKKDLLVTLFGASFVFFIFSPKFLWIWNSHFRLLPDPTIRNKTIYI